MSSSPCFLTSPNYYGNTKNCFYLELIVHRLCDDFIYHNTLVKQAFASDSFGLLNLGLNRSLNHLANHLNILSAYVSCLKNQFNLREFNGNNKSMSKRAFSFDFIYLNAYSNWNYGFSSARPCNLFDVNSINEDLFHQSNENSVYSRGFCRFETVGNLDPNTPSVTVEKNLVDNVNSNFKDKDAILEQNYSSNKNQLGIHLHQINGLVTSLSERDSRLVVHGNEFNDIESRLITSTNAIETLRLRIRTHQDQLATWLKVQEQTGFNNTCTDEVQSVSLQPRIVPIFLGLLSNLDVVSEELQRTGELLRACGRCSLYTTDTTHRLRHKLQKICSEQNSLSKEVSIQSLLAPFVIDAETQTFPSIEPKPLPQHTQDDSLTGCLDLLDRPLKYVHYETLLKYGLVCPRALMERSEHPPSSNHNDDLLSKLELQEALKNAIFRIDRFKNYRRTQKTRYDQLQERLDYMTNEMNLTIDTLRCHQVHHETQKQRMTLELTQLRNQLAKANALQDHYKKLLRMTNHKVNFTHSHISDDVHKVGQNFRASSSSPISVRNKPISGKTELVNSSRTIIDLDEVNLQLNIKQNELNQLHNELEKQRNDYDREVIKLRAQLTEASTDARNLRLKLNRFTASVSNIQELTTCHNTNTIQIEDSACSNCQKLQRLLDLIQSRRVTDPSAQKCSFLSVETQTNSGIIITDRLNATKGHQVFVPELTVQSSGISKLRNQCVATDPLSVECKGVYTDYNLDLFQGQNKVTQISTIPVKKHSPNEVFVEPDQFPNCSLPMCDNCTQTLETYTKFNCVPEISWNSSVDRANSQNTCGLNLDELTNRDSTYVLRDDEFYSRLINRLKVAEQEAALAMDQLKSSNAEFLTLRERLSHAQVERAHLKAAVEGLDEQNSLLESALYERTQELHYYQKRLIDVQIEQNYSITDASFDVSSNTIPTTTNSTINSFNGHYVPNSSPVFNNSGSNVIVNLTHMIKPELKIGRSPCGRTFSKKRLYYVRHTLSLLCQETFRLHKHISSRVTFWQPYILRLHGQPRPRPLLVFLLYFITVHLLLLHCWVF